jgi:hypothetical protein
MAEAGCMEKVTRVKDPLGIDRVRVRRRGLFVMSFRSLRQPRAADPRNGE